MDKKTFSKLVLWQVVLLVVMFVLGTELADFMFVTVVKPPARVVILLDLHIVLGVIVTLLAVAIYVGSLDLRNATVKKTSLIALIFMLVSLMAGTVFVLKAGNTYFEYIISLSFIILFGAYMYLVGMKY